MRFVDEVKIRVLAGKGGSGCLSFRREKYVPLGGPDGGDGGKGGDVMMVADERKQTLLAFRYRQLYRAESGKHGQGQNKHGRGGEDLILAAPVGTVIRDVATEELVADLSSPGSRCVVAKGGRGGRGNARFATPTHRAPRICEPGEAGEEREFKLELKLLADVGLVGFPNAGKSTLITALSAARPKIADYPFTTLIPSLGVVAYGDAQPFVMADIPGLIEGAHQGVGLGFQFLRHIERTRIILHVIDGSQLPLDDPLLPWRQIEHELCSYADTMASKPRMIVLNKCDLVADANALDAMVSAYREVGLVVLPISALARIGLTDLARALVAKLAEITQAAEPAETNQAERSSPPPDPE